MAPSADDLVRLVRDSLDDSKAEDVSTVNLEGRAAFADALVIATARSTVHVGAVADRLIRDVKAAGLPAPRVEGLPTCDWVLVDLGDVVVHLFRPEIRGFYNLEKLWGADRPAERKRA
ncbi:MAG: ribosome silencing factor [Hyphomicrobiales bacterium]|nr:ribosome silencing factor [Hyphomicrobiales bacterium]